MNGLCRDVQLHVLALCSLSELGHLAASNRAWNHATASDALWHALHCRLFCDGYRPDGGDDVDTAAGSSASSSRISQGKVWRDCVRARVELAALVPHRVFDLCSRSNEALRASAVEFMRANAALVQPTLLSLLDRMFPPFLNASSGDANENNAQWALDADSGADDGGEDAHDSPPQPPWYAAAPALFPQRWAHLSQHDLRADLARCVAAAAAIPVATVDVDRFHAGLTHAAWLVQNALTSQSWTALEAITQHCATLRYASDLFDTFPRDNIVDAGAECLSSSTLPSPSSCSSSSTSASSSLPARYSVLPSLFAAGSRTLVLPAAPPPTSTALAASAQLAVARLCGFANAEAIPWSRWFPLDLGAMIVSHVGNRRLRLSVLHRALDRLAAQVYRVAHKLTSVAGSSCDGGVNVAGVANRGGGGGGGSGYASALELIECMRAVLCERHGFGDAARAGQTAARLFAPESSYLSFVLKRQSFGLPITLSLLYLCVASRLGIPLESTANL